MVNLSDSIPSESIAVNSNYGFLVFSTLKAADYYLQMVRISTHAQVQDYLSNLGFISLGSTLYGHTSDTVTEQQSYDYLYDRYHIFQIEDVIFKPIG
ncbi:MAG: hypothetical protein C4308_11410 [Chitinophagaceae bacterium]